MIALKAKLKDANKARDFVMQKMILDRKYRIEKDSGFIFFPITKKVKTDFDILDYSFNSIQRPQDLKTTLSSKLTEKELDHLKTSFDTIGNIAILEIDEKLRKKEMTIAKTLIDINKNIKTVLRKSGKHSGEFRTQRLKFLAGEKTKEALHKENGVMLKLDVEKVYFSPRLSTERERIAKLVKDNEKILCLFSGCGPYPIVISKKNPTVSIISIEKNPIGVKYQLENIGLNKQKNIKAICGDAKKSIPKEAFDRILMPLPKSAEDFLQAALRAAKKNTIIHFYDFLHEDQFEIAHEKIKLACKKANLNYKIISTTKCGQHAPRVFRICVDFQII